LRKETTEKEEEGGREGKKGERGRKGGIGGRSWVLRCRRREGKLVVTESGPRFQPEISCI